MMSSNRLLVILSACLVLIIAAYGSFFVVTPRQQALVLRFGEIKSVNSEPGIYFKLPFSFLGADRVQYLSNQDLRFDVNDLRIQVADGKYYIVDAFAMYRIADPARFRTASKGDLARAESQLKSQLDAGLRQVYGLRGFQAALSSERTSMMEEAQELLRREAEKLGVKVVDVRILRTDLTPDVSEQTYKRMISERNAEAESTRADGRETAQKRRATADRQVIEISSQAEKEAQILRGEGDAERNRILGAAYNLDPEFFDFYRSMDAYRGVINENSTMVLSPTSEFFRYFNTSGADAINGASALIVPEEKSADTYGN